MQSFKNPFSSFARGAVALACMGVLALGCVNAGAQSAGQSRQVIKLIVGYAAGGPVDAAARIFAKRSALSLS